MPDPTISAPDYASLTHPQTGSGGTSFWNDAITQHMLGPEGGPQINPFASADQPTRQEAWNKDPITQDILNQIPPAKTTEPTSQSETVPMSRDTAPVSPPESQLSRSTPSFSHMARDLAGPFEAPSESPSRSYSVAGPQSTQSDFGNKLLGALGKGAYVLANVIQGGAYGRAGINKPTYAEQQNERAQALRIQGNQFQQEQAMARLNQEMAAKMAFVNEQASAALSKATSDQERQTIGVQRDAQIAQIQEEYKQQAALIRPEAEAQMLVQRSGTPGGATLAGKYGAPPEASP